MEQDFRQASSLEDTADVVIMGAGVAGLTAALRILDRAKQQKLPAPRIVILEADSKPGGRVKSQRHSNGHFVDSGAHWFHDGDDNPFYRWYCDRYGPLAVDNDPLEHRTIIAGGGAHGMEYRTKIEEALYKQYLAFKENNADTVLTLDQLVKLTDCPGAANFAEYIARNWYAVESPSQISCDDLYGEGPGPGGLQAKGGMETVIRTMADELTARGVVIKTGEPVASVRQADGRAVLTTANGHVYNAGQVVSTASVGVLQRRMIEIIPPPSDEVTSYVNSIIMGKMTKVIVPMTDEFFEKNHLEPNSHFYLLDSDPPVFCHVRAAGEPFISILVGGKEAEALEKQPREVIRTFVDNIFGQVGAFSGYESAITGEPLVTGWASDPRYFGAYSACAPGARRRGPIRDGRVVYGGEAFAPPDETGKDLCSTVAGAWFSGQLSGDNIFAQLAPELAARRHPAAPIPKVGKVAVLDRGVLHVVDADDPISLALLTRAYNEVYLPAIRIASERESLDEWIKAMQGRAMSPDPSIIVIAGDFSGGLEHSTVKGLAVADYHLKSGVGVLAYNTVAPEYRGEGLGRVLFDARIALLQEMAQAYGRELQGVFFEINNPKIIQPGEDSIDPAKRMKIYSKMGASPVPIDYVQPPLAGSGEKCRNMLLMAWPIPGKGMPGRGIIGEFLDGIYEATIGPGYESDPDLKAMKAQLQYPIFDEVPSAPPPAEPEAGASPN